MFLTWKYVPDTVFRTKMKVKVGKQDSELCREGSQKRHSAVFPTLGSLLSTPPPASAPGYFSKLI